MRFPDLAAWLDWQAKLNPKAVDLGLERVREVWSNLGEPLLQATVITVAGTNGKGSSVAFAEAILQAAGYRTGCYTSPHLLAYNERIRVDQSAVDNDRICEAFERIDNARGDILLTYFEFGTLAALLIFAESRLDAVVLEVGLGGRLDAVNLVDPDVALITGVALDHQEWLGEDREKIGREKAGVLRAGRPAVFAGRDLPASIRAEAERLGTDLQVAGEDYRVERRDEDWDLLSGESISRSLPLPGMRGAVQLDNAAGVLVALDAVAHRLPVDQRAVRAGLLGARVPGRFEIRPGRPTWVLDVAHNPQAAGALSGMLGDFFTRGRRIAVCGMLNDKDAAGVARVLAKRFDAWYLVDLSAEARGMASSELAKRMRTAVAGIPLEIRDDVCDVLAEIRAEATEDDLVVVFGSFLTVGAASRCLDRLGTAPAAA